MSLDLSGKIILITGATDGLGKEIAHSVSKAGAKVIIHGRTSQKVSEVVKDIPNATGLVCDLRESNQISQVFSQIEKIDILINNAGLWLEGSITDATEEKIIELTNVNMLAPLLITRALLPKLLMSPFGQILNIVSTDGVVIPHEYFASIYIATKYAMQGFTEGLAKEFYTKNLRVMGYYPGGMNTKLFKKAGNRRENESWMFDVSESVDAILYMLTRSKSVNLKRMDLVKQ